jgi:hypothetical protein
MAFAVAAETWGIFSVMVNSIAFTFDINTPPCSYSSVSFTKGYSYGTDLIREVESMKGGEAVRQKLQKKSETKLMIKWNQIQPYL